MGTDDPEPEAQHKKKVRPVREPFLDRICDLMGFEDDVELYDDDDEDEYPDIDRRHTGFWSGFLQNVKHTLKIALVISVIVGLVLFIAPRKTLRIYNKAQTLYENGEYVQAFETLNQVDLDCFPTMLVDRIHRKDASVKDILLACSYEFQKESFRDIDVGSTVFFGLYEQNSNTKDGIEQIEWIVLTVADGKALLVSRNILAREPFDDSSYPSSDWSNSSLRLWLNKVFFNGSFSAQQARYIQTVSVQSQSNPVYNTGTSAGVSQDTVFILSEDELNSYIGAEQIGSFFPQEQGDWWIRTAGKYDYYAMVADYYGDMDYNGEHVSRSIGIRPAIWVDLDLVNGE